MANGSARDGQGRSDRGARADRDRRRGTFTDIIVFDEATGQVVVHQVPSTSRDPSEAIVDGVTQVLGEHGVAVEQVAYFAHGSTVATNALIQHRGARVGLITTAGFRDLLESGRQTRPRGRRTKDQRDSAWSLALRQVA